MGATSDHHFGTGDRRPAEEGDEILLIYDEVPRMSPCRLHLVNARDTCPVVKKITAAGLDIDQ